MDEDGQWAGLTELESRTRIVLDGGFTSQLLDQQIQFVAMVVRRSTYEELGGFRLSLPHCWIGTCGSALRCSVPFTTTPSRWPASGCMPAPTAPASSQAGRTSGRSDAPSPIPAQSSRRTGGDGERAAKKAAGLRAALVQERRAQCRMAPACGSRALQLGARKSLPATSLSCTTRWCTDPGAPGRRQHEGRHTGGRIRHADQRGKRCRDPSRWSRSADSRSSGTS